MDIPNRENNGDATEETHRRHEQDATVQVDIHGIGADPAQKVTKEPVAFIEVIHHSQGQSTYKEKICNGKVEHVYLERCLLLVCPDEDT